MTFFTEEDEDEIVNELIEEYGDEKEIEFLVGQAMEKSDGRMNPATARRKLSAKLNIQNG